MKTQLTLTVDSEIKSKFQDLVRKKGSNMSKTTNMLFINYINNGELDESHDDNEPVEMGFIPYEELSKEDKILLNKSKKSNNRINNHQNG